MLQHLPQERWPELTDVFRQEFDASLPHSTADILADVDDDGRIRSFVVLEFLCRVGQIYQTGSASRRMFKQFESQIPPGNSVIAIAHEPRFERLCEKFGMRKCEGVVYRRDF